MSYDGWFKIFGDDAQATARLMGTTDTHMDACLEQLYFMFQDSQKGDLGFNEKVIYGNLQDPQANG